eukprot:CAMPEP_0184295636 /NCGR_PEP_ID=MMETSP1049-20130417/6496_1 /TAXON_ID=77928 /ORGANISM="Proteomonas sulcata, Strain CCMP704" /LENGTH=59 /DNA_ID=CAMNT_0026604279 /DNA_START=55 /DNA_END=234 /DNA_ORIENTATION=-
MAQADASDILKAYVEMGLASEKLKEGLRPIAAEEALTDSMDVDQGQQPQPLSSSDSQGL